MEKKLLYIAIILIILGLILTFILSAEKSPIKINQPLNISIYFCPKDNCKDIFLDTIENSNKIHCALYDLDFNLPNKTLLITDKSNKVSNSITNKGYQLMHNKFCILDNKIITLGSMNPTERGTSKNNNNLVIINSKELAKNYEEEFQELYQGTFGSGKQTKNTKFEFQDAILENYFCPEDFCSRKIIKYLENAEESIYFMAFSFTHEQIAQTLVKKHNQGIKVQGILEKQRINMQYNKYKYLNENNISITLDSNSYIMHHKVFIIDDKITIFGSFNPTKAADTKNDENILIINNKEIANKFIQEFIDLNTT
jgi:phosphatidylserine/phosphatidylglycerophosphate/cardiolipin synthase-like enzyme